MFLSYDNYDERPTIFDEPLPDRITLYTHTTFTGSPSEDQIKILFANDPRIKGRKLISFRATIDHYANSNDPYTSYYNLYADHYDITATFE